MSALDYTAEKQEKQVPVSGPHDEYDADGNSSIDGFTALIAQGEKPSHPTREGWGDSLTSASFVPLDRSPT